MCTFEFHLPVGNLAEMANGVCSNYIADRDYIAVRLAGCLTRLSIFARHFCRMSSVVILLLVGSVEKFDIG
jgi:hypothetical protein